MVKIEEVVLAIINEQSQIVGESIAKYVASNSGVVKFGTSSSKDIIILVPEPDKAINKLVDSYRGLFGQASVEVCLNVVKKYKVSSTNTNNPTI